MDETQSGGYSDLKTRLDQIVDAVSDENLPLEEALDLYEEAVGLGLQASRLMEQDIQAQDVSDEAEGEAQSQDGASSQQQDIQA